MSLALSFLLFGHPRVGMPRFLNCASSGDLGQQLSGFVQPDRVISTANRLEVVKTMKCARGRGGGDTRKKSMRGGLE